MSVVRDPSARLVIPNYERAQLRRVRDINKDRLGPAIHAALQVGAAAVRALGEKQLRLPATDPVAWLSEISRPRPQLQLADVLMDLWQRGIPVVHVETLPTPSFQGLAAIVERRPVIVLGHNVDEPARLAFIIAHEVAHIIFGDCTPDQPVVDEEEEISDDHEIERRADGYASALLTGGSSVPDVSANGFKELATKAGTIEKERGVDASAVVWAWARRTGNYAMATMAARALYRMTGGKRLLREHLDANVDLENTSESDRALLRCLHGDPERDAATG